MPRLLLISGKGGVGKTTVAAATAAACARQGHRTLVLSFDLAHSLRDSFNVPDTLVSAQGARPVTIADRLDLQEIDVYEELERDWSPVYRYVAGLMSQGGADSALADELAVIPGMEDLAALIAIDRYFRDDRYDVIVLDCPPTGASLRFVGLAAGLKSYARQRLAKERKLVGIIRPLAQLVTKSGLYLPEDAFFDSLARIVDRIAEVERLLLDPRITTARLVGTPEKIVMRETQRAFMYFGMYGIHVDLAVVNRVFTGDDPYFVQWSAAQSLELRQIQRELKGVPVATVPMFPEEVYGPEALARVADIVYGGRDPAAVLAAGNSIRTLPTDDGRGFRVEIDLPFVEKDQIEMSREEGDLILRIGTFQRRIELPAAAAALPTRAAGLVDGILTVTFGTPPPTPATAPLNATVP